ncbi:MAG: hypothetical protein ACYC27_08825 [Armatimonadota bacterium]
MSVRLMEELQTISDTYRQFIPTEEGESLEEQIFPWSMDGIRQKMNQPLPAHDGDPRTMWNIIQMMAVEAQHWFDYHAYAKMTSNPEFKSLLVSLARAEHVHHQMLMSLIPKPHDASEMVLLGEMALIASYHMAMNNEPNDAIKSAFKHISDDHMQHAQFAVQMVQSKGCDPAAMTGKMDLSEARPIEKQFMRPNDVIWQGRFDGSYHKNDVHPQTLINVDMALAGETAAWDKYSCAMKNTDDMNTRTNYAAFQSIEDQHASILGSIKDPMETILDRSLVHEQVEIQNYGMLMMNETNPQVKKVFADLYNEDMEQARLFGQMAK